ncbi:hypothetical protein DFJ73DRAFT_823826 [Zopfochytrium polystomum]|nr:hypothetical protein DFJ73DRAFT_823826 [Zopfochytrium polystomum]
MKSRTARDRPQRSRGRRRSVTSSGSESEERREDRRRHSRIRSAKRDSSTDGSERDERSAVRRKRRRRSPSYSESESSTDVSRERRSRRRRNQQGPKRRRRSVSESSESSEYSESESESESDSESGSESPRQKSPVRRRNSHPQHRVSTNRGSPTRDNRKFAPVIDAEPSQRASHQNQPQPALRDGHHAFPREVESRRRSVSPAMRSVRLERPAGDRHAVEGNPLVSESLSSAELRRNSNESVQRKEDPGEDKDADSASRKSKKSKKEKKKKSKKSKSKKSKKKGSESGSGGDEVLRSSITGKKIKRKIKKSKQDKLDDINRQNLRQHLNMLYG